MAASSGFEKLHSGVQKWVWSQNWTVLRDIQEAAIDPVLEAESDIIISASTAAGKTEAAFMPACSAVVHKDVDGIGILYISPLKALINDQYRRLLSLCDHLDLPVTPWHGDVLRSLKNKQIKKPSGILLITPESLESLLLNRMGWCKTAFQNLSYIIIDEFHAFIGSERGRQLQSLMRRLEFLIKKTIPRVALSATLGDMKKVEEALRTGATYPCKRIESKLSHSDLKVQLRGYVEPSAETDAPVSFREIVADLYKFLRKSSNLIFANSRERTESIAAALSDFCEKDGVPNEFFPHHGSLSKELRESLEARLQKGKLPTSAVCTMTLELGIDIGAVDSIAQVTPPHSVSALRQRLGRSGRRGEPAILRMFIPEKEITDSSHIVERLRLNTFQSAAMVNLMVREKWYEPPSGKQYHFSTLAQQSLSVIGQYGGVQAPQLWSLLCDTGPFKLVDQKLFVSFLRALGEKQLITQLEDGQLTLGVKGEQLIEHFSFYSAFKTPEEYKLECDGKVLGAIPIDNPLDTGQHIIFAGRRWEVMEILPQEKLILLKKAVGGKPPYFFDSHGSSIHEEVRREMLRMYVQRDMPIYLDKRAEESFNEGLRSFDALKLNQKHIIQIGASVHLLPWSGDKVCNTITVLLHKKRLSANCFGGVIDIQNSTGVKVENILDKIFADKRPKATELASILPDTFTEKHDVFLTKELRDIGYGAKYFDIEKTFNWLEKFHSNAKN